MKNARNIPENDGVHMNLVFINTYNFLQAVTYIHHTFVYVIYIISTVESALISKPLIFFVIFLLGYSNMICNTYILYI